jgi:hypothetical protein
MRSTADLRRVLNGLKEKEAVMLELYRDGQARKFSLVPDKNEKPAWNLEHFSKKMEDLKENIGDETKAFYQDEIRRLRQSREKEYQELQKQAQHSLLKVNEETRKLAQELKKLQEEKSRLGAMIKKENGEKLRKIQEEIRQLQEKLQSEAEGKEG